MKLKDLVTSQMTNIEKTLCRKVIVTVIITIYFYLW